MIVFVNTNGSLVEKRASEISRENFDFVRVSIDGTREFHDKVRRYSGAFDSAIRAVEIFNKKKISCMINTVVTDFTEAGMMSGLLGKARELGVKVSLTPAIHSLPCIENPQRKDLGKDLKKTLISMQKFLRVLREAQKQYPEVIDDPGAYWKIIEKGGLEKYGCRVMDTAIGIKPDGRLGFPCADFPAKAVAGRTLAEAYYGKEAEKQRRLQGKYWFCENCFSRCGAFPTMLLDAKALLSLAISWSDF